MADRGDDVRGSELADRVEGIADSLEHGYNDYVVSVLRKAARRLRGGEGEREHHCSDDDHRAAVWIHENRMGGSPCLYGHRITMRQLDRIEREHGIREILRRWDYLDRDHVKHALRAWRDLSPTDGEELEIHKCPNCGGHPQTRGEMFAEALGVDYTSRHRRPAAPDTEGREESFRVDEGAEDTIPAFGSTPSDPLDVRPEEAGGEGPHLSGQRKKPRCVQCRELLLSDEGWMCDECLDDWVTTVAAKANDLLREEWGGV